MQKLVEFVMYAAIALHAREVLKSMCTHTPEVDCWRVITVFDMMDILWDEQDWRVYRQVHQRDRPFLEVLVEYANLHLDAEIDKRVALAEQANTSRTPDTPPCSDATPKSA